MSEVMSITSENFEQEVLKSNQAVLVDFWAPWCGPCRMVGPVIDELASQYQGKIKVGKINVDEQGTLAAKFKVMSIPTIAVFKDGAVAEKVVGARSKQDLENMVNKYL